MNCNSKLILLRGNSGSGKSVTARALQRKFGRGTMVISQDVVRREMLWVKDEKKKNSKTVSLIINLVKYGKENSDVVILEGILYSDFYIELFEMLKAEFPLIYAYYYDIPFEETLIRHQTKPNRDQFGECDMRRWWREKDYIGIIPEIPVTEKMSLEETVEMIFSDVTSSGEGRG